MMQGTRILHTSSLLLCLVTVLKEEKKENAITQTPSTVPVVLVSGRTRWDSYTPQELETIFKNQNITNLYISDGREPLLWWFVWVRFLTEQVYGGSLPQFLEWAPIQKTLSEEAGQESWGIVSKWMLTGGGKVENC